MSTTVTDPFQSPVQRLTTGVPGKQPVKPPVGAPATAVVPQVQTHVPAATRPVQPTLMRPTGPPVQALTTAGFYGSIQDFNNQVAKAHQDYLLQFGIQPDARTMLQLATAVPTGDPNRLPALKTSLVAPPVPPTSRADVTGLLSSLRANAHAGFDQYQQFMDLHGDTIQHLLHDPATKAVTLKAVTDASTVANLNMPQSQSAIRELGKIGEAALKTVPWAAVTLVATAKDTYSADRYIHSGGKQGSLDFPNLTRTAPAIAQVVKGLVYSPAGVAQVLKAVSHDLIAADTYARTGGREGSLDFSHTAEIAKATGSTMLQDLSDPKGRAGYLFLDALGFASLGAGAAARVGAFARAAGEETGIGASVAAGARAAARPHALPTAVLSKNGYSETISLSGNPLLAWAEKNAPVFGTDAQQARLTTGVAGTTLEGDEFSSLVPPDRVSQWVAKVLSPEERMGRAGNIRRNTEYKTLNALGGTIQQAAGSTMNFGVISHLLPDGWQRGLSRGEVKAIQASSWDVAGDLSAKITAEERFHQQMREQGVGDPVAHVEQIANLALARKAIAAPSKRFVETLDAVVRAQAQAERLRKEMGLQDSTAENRVARAGAIIRGEDLVPLPDGTLGMKVGDEVLPIGRVTDESFYAPIKPKGKPSGRPSSSQVKLSRSDFGMGPPTISPYEKHVMTGDALRDGDFRVDLHNQTAEGLARIARAIPTYRTWQNAWDHATETPTGPHDIPIRDIKTIPDELRKAINQFYDGHLDTEAVSSLPEELHKVLFPDSAGEGDHVKYIDQRILGQAADPSLDPGVIARGFEYVNNALRPLIFYINPKYALNLLGNTAMLVFDQGFLRSGQNIARAMTLDKWAVGDDAATIRSLMNAGRSHSYVNPSSGAFSKQLADFWNSFTDQDTRVASWTYYADRAGFKTPEQVHDLISNPDHASTLNDVTKRAEDGQVAYDRLSPYEKATVRHVLFVYPWVRGSALWSLKEVFEHPAKAAILATLGQEAYQDDKWLTTAPAWMRRVGYIPYHWNGDHVGIIDPSSVNTFSTVGQLLGTLKGGIEGDLYANMGDMLGPPGQLLTHGILGVDTNGNPYPNGQWYGAAVAALNTIPEVAAFNRSNRGQGEPLKPADVAKRSSLLARANSAMKQTVLTPGWLNGYGNIIAGGFSPREINLSAAAARYWRTATPAQKQQREVQFLNQALKIQGDYLGKPVPDDVGRAVKDAAQLVYSARVEAKKIGRNLTLKEQALNTVDYYTTSGRIPAGKASQLRTLIRNTDATPDLTHQIAAVKAKYGYMQALHDWDKQISTAVSFTVPGNVQARLAALKQYNIEGSVTDPKAYGVGYANYLADRQQLSRDLARDPDRAQQLRIFDDQHLADKGGPGFSVMRLTEGNSQQAQARVNHLLNNRWGGLSGSEKEVLGVTVPENLSVAWAAYDQTVKAVRSRDGAVTRDQKLFVVKELNGSYPGFQKDWQVSQQARVTRLYNSPIAGQIPDRAEFDQAIGSPAREYAKAMAANGNYAYYRHAWNAYINGSAMQEWLKSKPQLQAWVESFGTRFLTGLVNTG